MIDARPHGPQPAGAGQDPVPAVELKGRVVVVPVCPPGLAVRAVGKRIGPRLESFPGLVDGEQRLAGLTP